MDRMFERGDPAVASVVNLKRLLHVRQIGWTCAKGSHRGARLLGRGRVFRIEDRDELATCERQCIVQRLRLGPRRWFAPGLRVNAAVTVQKPIAIMTPNRQAIAAVLLAVVGASQSQTTKPIVRLKPIRRCLAFIPRRAPYSGFFRESCSLPAANA